MGHGGCGKTALPDRKVREAGHKCGFVSDWGSSHPDMAGCSRTSCSGRAAIKAPECLLGSCAATGVNSLECCDGAKIERGYLQTIQLRNGEKRMLSRFFRARQHVSLWQRTKCATWLMRGYHASFYYFDFLRA